MLAAGLVQLWAALMLQWTFGSFLGRTMGLSGVATVAFIGGMGSVLVSANFATKTISTGVTGPGMALLGECTLEAGSNCVTPLAWIAAGVALLLRTLMPCTPQPWCLVACVMLMYQHVQGLNLA